MPDIYTKGGGTTDGVYALLMDMAEQQGGGKGTGGQGVPDQWDNCADAPGDAAQQAQDQAEMGVNVHQATAIARMQGRLGSALERFINAALKPKVDWKEVLRRFVSQRAKVERSYATPRRRWLAEDIYLPALGGERMGEMLIAVDCSGSVSDKEIGEFAAEMLAIKQDVNPWAIHVIYFHHEVSKYDRFAHDEELTIAPNGTGGTAFSPIFAYAAAHDINPECCVVLTDLCCSDFGPAPEYPVLWVSNDSDSAPWGQVVLMRDQR
jgi:predicted metal-dependent peptidase